MEERLLIFFIWRFNNRTGRRFLGSEMCEDCFHPEASERTKFWMFITPIFAPENIPGVWLVSRTVLPLDWFGFGFAPSFLSHSVLQTSYAVVDDMLRRSYPDFWGFCGHLAEPHCRVTHRNQEAFWCRFFFEARHWTFPVACLVRFPTERSSVLIFFTVTGFAFLLGAPFQVLFATHFIFS